MTSKHDPSTLTTGWRTIDTAPAQEKILVAQDGSVFIAELDEDRHQWWTDDDKFNDAERYFPPRGVSPTHWMPLPEPPLS